MSIEQLESMSQCSIEEIPKSSLADVSNIKVDTNLPVPLRMVQFFEQVQNPYCFLCGEIPIHISFVNEGRELSEALVEYFCTLKP